MILAGISFIVLGWLFQLTKTYTGSRAVSPWLGLFVAIGTLCLVIDEINYGSTEIVILLLVEFGAAMLVYLRLRN